MLTFVILLIMGNNTFGISMLQGGATQIAGAAINEGMGLLFQPMKNKQQYKQAEKLQKLQIQGSKELTDYNTAKQLQMWKDTSYGAQKEQMELAGINPALLYGMSGGGGQTAQINTGQVSGQSAAAGQSAMGIQNMLTKAQIDNLNANTRKQNADAAKTEGPDTVKTNTETASIAQGIENQKAAKALMDIEMGIKELELKILI